MSTVSSTSADQWLRTPVPAPDAVCRLLCLPHAGGSASYYLPLARVLSPAIELVAVQYPGRQDRRREPPVDRLPELAGQVAEAATPLTDRPLAVFGHSMGAVVGFDAARRFEAAGHRVAHLFVSGRRAPSRHRDETSHLLADDALLDEVAGLSGTSAGLLADEEVRAMILPALRADYRAAETYRYGGGPPLHCPITALVGDADPKVTVDEARSWADHTSAPFALRVFDGGHFYLQQYWPELAALIDDTWHPAP